LGGPLKEYKNQRPKGGQNYQGGYQGAVMAPSTGARDHRGADQEENPEPPRQEYKFHGPFFPWEHSHHRRAGGVFVVGGYASQA
jgi:hypothetical protein